MDSTWSKTISATFFKSKIANRLFQTFCWNFLSFAQHSFGQAVKTGFQLSVTFSVSFLERKPLYRKLSDSVQKNFLLCWWKFQPSCQIYILPAEKNLGKFFGVFYKPSWKFRIFRIVFRVRTNDYQWYCHNWIYLSADLFCLILFNSKHGCFPKLSKKTQLVCQTRKVPF